MTVDPHPAARRQPALKRRTFLQLGAAAVAASGLSGAARGRPIPTLTPARSLGKARNLIFMVSDGMSFGTLTLADMFRRQHEGRASHWVSLFGQPGVRRGLYATHAANSLVTDSAASGTAWGCGHRVNNGTINISPDGVQRLPLLVQAAQYGKATGLATTTRLTHATPASFIANIPRRDWEKPIAQQMLDRNLDIGLGGGANFFHDDMLAAATDVHVVRDRSALLEAAAAPLPAGRGRLLGLFARSHLPFELDRPATVPTLAEMTRAALTFLDRKPEGFVLQIEGGRVDHAGHSNDAASIVREQLAFDDAVAEVLRYINIDGGSSRRDDTLVILTSDHGNGNPGLTLYGPDGRDGFDRLARVKRSFEWLWDELHVVVPGKRSEVAPRLVTEGMGIELDEEDRAVLAAALASKRVAPFREMSKFEQVLGGLLANHFGVSFVSGNHTSDYVEVTALGPGSEDLRPTGHNTDLHDLAVQSLALGPGRLLDDMKDRIDMPAPPRPD
jgi:alkaline phosphatase